MTNCNDDCNQRPIVCLTQLRTANDRAFGAADPHLYGTSRRCHLIVASNFQGTAKTFLFKQSHHFARLPYWGNSPDKVCHTRSVAYSVELGVLNNNQISGGWAYLDCYPYRYCLKNVSGYRRHPRSVVTLQQKLHITQYQCSSLSHHWRPDFVTCLCSYLRL